jgi:outer membrane beta-barrel protein
MLSGAALFVSLALPPTVVLAAEEQTAGNATQAQQEKKAPQAPLSGDQLLTPKVKRNKIKVGRIDTEDFELGPFVGLYSIEDFGTHMVVGGRFAIHLSESFFVEANYGQTKGGRSSAESLLSKDFITEADRNLTYYNLLFGFNFLPGEAFIGKNWAFVNELYLVAGAGNTTFGGEDRFTVVGGFGYRFLVTDWMAAHIDYKDHLFKTDFFGQEKTTNNMEIHMGFTIFF